MRDVPVRGMPMRDMPLRGVPVKDMPVIDMAVRVICNKASDWLNTFLLLLSDWPRATDTF